MGGKKWPSSCIRIRILSAISDRIMLFFGDGCYPCSRLLMNSLVAILNNSANFRSLLRANPVNLACSAVVIPIVRRDFLFSSSDNKGRPTSFFCFPDIVVLLQDHYGEGESVVIGSPSPIICVFSSSNITSSTELSKKGKLRQVDVQREIKPSNVLPEFNTTGFQTLNRQSPPQF